MREKVDHRIMDSIVTHIKCGEISKRLLQSKVYVKHFSSDKAQCMKNYLNPSLRQNPGHFILNAGTTT